jgi:sugar/nucleoside kinase (ribokinase family)
MAGLGVLNMAITRGNKPISYQSGDRDGEIPVPQVNAVDTLGAGDIFHGAFCYYLVNSEIANLEQKFTNGLARAAAIAADSCRFFGTRQWMRVNNKKIN